MPSDENYQQQIRNNNILVSRRRIPFESNTTRIPSTSSMKRTISNGHAYSKSSDHREIFLNKSSSSSSLVEDDENEVKTLEDTIVENPIDEFERRRSPFNDQYQEKQNRIETNSRDRNGGSMIEQLLQSNMDLKKEIRDIRRQIKHNTNTGTTNNNNNNNRRYKDRSHQKKNSNIDDSNDCSYIPGEFEYYNESSASSSQLQQYKNEAAMYKKQLETCQDTIIQLRKTINTMEKNIEHLKKVQQRPSMNSHENNSTSNSNNTDHRFIHELFHLCIKHTSKSSRSSNITPSHNDMKTYIRQTFNDLTKSSPSPSMSLKNSTIHQNEKNHFICKCSERIHTDHRPSYQFCLSVMEQCQNLFDVVCYTQLPTALNELYYRHGELINFKKSIASTLGITGSSRSVSCPKLIKTLQQLLDDARSNELITFKKMAKINDMNEAISKIRSYDDFVPYYHQFIEQMANLLEVSKGDEIMPAIKTLKLLAHGDSRRESFTSSQQVSQTLTRTSSINLYKNSFDDSRDRNLFVSKSLQLPSSRSTNESSTDRRLNISDKVDENSEQTQGGTDEGDL